MALLLLAVLVGAGVCVLRQGDKYLTLSPRATLTPEDSAPDTRSVTLPGKTWYALQLGVFEKESAAAGLAEAFRARGAGGFVDGQDNFRVLAAAYPSRADAQAVQSQLRAAHQVDAFICDVTRPEIVLRLTGQKAQLTALLDAYDALDQAAEHLSSLSCALDNREMKAEEILPALQSRRDTATALARRLAALFGESPHPAVREIIALLSDLSQALDSALAASGETRLGAQIKYCQLLCICRMADYARKLAP